MKNYYNKNMISFSIMNNQSDLKVLFVYVLILILCYPPNRSSTDFTILDYFNSD